MPLAPSRVPRSASASKDGGLPSADLAPPAGVGNRAMGELFKEGTPPPPRESATGLLVDDETATDGSRMPKSEFLSSLRAAVCASTDEALAGTGRDSQGCPWIEHWIGYYEGQDAAHVERALRRYAPESAGAATARDYIPIVVARVRRSVDRWAKTGEVSGMPEETPGPGLEGPFFNARPGGARSADPVSVRAELGTGRPLPEGLRSRMESAFGASFGGVRLHTDATGSRLSERLNARAFTVGEHVAFGGGEFRPGTIAGDALIAHELAHVAQQDGAAAERAPQGGEGAGAPLERDADTTAARALVSMLTGARRQVADVGRHAADLGRHAVPRLQSGLRIQRCGMWDSEPEKAVKEHTPPEIAATPEALGHHAVECMIAANKPVKPKSQDSGIWYHEGYKSAYPDLFQEDYVNGYANPDYWERIGVHHWRLRDERSASAGVKAWLEGLTIADCISTAYVAEVDAVRAAIGDERFDERYGAEGQSKVEWARLTLGAHGSSALTQALEPIAISPGRIGQRPAQVGDRCYFGNHPTYLLKHPGGAYQGENAMLREDTEDGNQLWEGLGQPKVTEQQMYENMAEDYNRVQDKWDEAKLEEIKQDNDGVLPPDYEQAREATITWEDILTAPPYTIPGEKVPRKGGFNPTAWRLNPERVEKLKKKR